MMNLCKLSVCSMLIFSTATFAATKTYTLLNVQTVVSNDPSCQATYQQLETLAKQPLQFQFTRQSDNRFMVSELNSTAQDHSYKMVDESINGTVVTRVGMGTFTLQNQPIQYVLSIAADTAQANFKPLYPVILSSHQAHCYFTALLKPDAATQKAFKQKLQAGAVANSKDLEGE